MKKIIIATISIIAVAVGANVFYYYFNMANAPENNAGLIKNQAPTGGKEQASDESQKIEQDQASNAKDEENKENQDTASKSENETKTVIGKSSIMLREITAYHFGNGEKEVLLIGGIHGGYSWNTALLAYQMIDYIKTNTKTIPANVKVTVIPVLNPDGLSKVVDTADRFTSSDVSSSQEAKISGRFNGTGVDLNRNFDCNWKARGIWQNKPVSGGDRPFSEPESAAIRDYAKDRKLSAVVAWYSSGGGVYSSSCGNGILAETKTITDIYAKASGYKAYNNFESYQVSGDMTDWFSKNNVPAISVLLTTANDTEWDKNWKGILSLLEYYSK